MADALPPRRSSANTTDATTASAPFRPFLWGGAVVTLLAVWAITAIGSDDDETGTVDRVPAVTNDGPQRQLSPPIITPLRQAIGPEQLRQRAEQIRSLGLERRFRDPRPSLEGQTRLPTVGMRHAGLPGRGYSASDANPGDAAITP